MIQKGNRKQRRVCEISLCYEVLWCGNKLKSGKDVPSNSNERFQVGLGNMKKKIPEYPQCNNIVGLTISAFTKCLHEIFDKTVG